MNVATTVSPDATSKRMNSIFEFNLHVKDFSEAQQKNPIPEPFLGTYTIFVCATELEKMNRIHWKGSESSTASDASISLNYSQPQPHRRPFCSCYVVRLHARSSHRRMCAPPNACSYNMNATRTFLNNLSHSETVLCAFLSTQQPFNKPCPLLIVKRTGLSRSVLGYFRSLAPCTHITHSHTHTLAAHMNVRTSGINVSVNRIFSIPIAIREIGSLIYRSAMSVGCVVGCV